MVTNTRQVLYTAAADQNNAVLLQVMADAGDVGTDFNTVRKSYSGDFSQRGVRLFGGSGLYSSADTSFLRGVVIDSHSLLRVPALQQCQRLGYLLRTLSALA